MSQAKTKGKAAAEKAAAERSDAVEAIEETNGSKQRVAEVRGFTFILPDKPPFKVLLANRRLTQARRNRNEQTTLEGLIELAEAFIGEERYAEFVAEFDAQEGLDATADLISAVDDAYGVSEGESSASSDS